MLCDRCQKNEATCFFSFASASVDIHLKRGEEIPESWKGFGRKINPGDKASPKREPMSSLKLCRACAKERDNELMPSMEITWAEQRKAQRKDMDDFRQKCRSLCKRIGLTVAAQKALLAKLELETPGIFDWRRGRGEFSPEKIKAEHTLMMDKISAAVASEFPAHSVSPEEIMMLKLVLKKLKLKKQVAQRIREETESEFPELTPEEREELVFLSICLHEAAQEKSDTYGETRAADILAVAADVAGTLYDERATDELRKMGIVSSEALGKVVFLMVEKGMLGKSEEDSIEDFNVRSALDDFLEGSG